MKYSWAIESHVGLVRAGNEDSFSPPNDDSSEGPIIIAVADGMGGATAGEVASGLAIEAATAEGVAADTDPADRVQAANEALNSAIATDPTLAGMGTTLTLGVFDPDGILRLAHVGDSRAYLLHDGVLRQLTEDHTLVARLVADGIISPEEARTHPRRHVVMQSIGMPEVAVDRIDEQLEPGDRVLICSDGLTGMVEDEDVARILIEASSPAEAAWHLIDAANAAGGHDNTTVAVVDVTP